MLAVLKPTFTIERCAVFLNRRQWADIWAKGQVWQMANEARLMCWHHMPAHDLEALTVSCEIGVWDVALIVEAGL